MNKKSILVIVIVLILIIVIGVIWSTKNTKNIEINIEDLAGQLVESGIFEDELAKTEPELIYSKYGLDANAINKLVVYQGSGATSEELIILQAKDNIKEIKQKLEEEKEERKEVFESYLPEEVFKIDNSILETKGNYLIFCISGDSNKASEIINNYING